MNHLWPPRIGYPRRATCALLVGVAAMHASDAVGGSLEKEFYSNEVAENAPINAGGRVQTWAGSDLPEDDVTIKAAGAGPKGAKGVTRHFVHASTLTSGPKVLPPGLPIAATGNTVAQGYTGTTTTADSHVAPNSASATVTVDVQKFGGAARIRRPGNPPTFDTFILSNSVHGKIETRTTPGLPTDHDKYHSADSFAGAEITAAKTFIKTGTIGNVPIFQELGRNTVSLGGSSAVDRDNNASEGGVLRDPWFLTVNDLTTGVSTRQEFMTEDITYSNASIVLDDSGMHLTVRLGDPTSVATIDFSTELPWVVNPYSYSVRLDDSGLTLGGSTSLGDWNVTTTGSTMTADLSFGADGMPFEEADVMPDASLFTNGDAYSYDVGRGGGLSEFATSIPEPANVAMLLSGLALMAGLSRRRPAHGTRP